MNFVSCSASLHSEGKLVNFMHCLNVPLSLIVYSVMQLAPDCKLLDHAKNFSLCDLGSVGTTGANDPI